MKREILFRGKRVDNGKWIEGNLFETNKSTVKSLSLIPMIQVIDRDTLYHSSYEVHPESVGQFTGLTDKNGVKIFEGDIVETKFGIGYIKYQSCTFLIKDDKSKLTSVNSLYSCTDCGLGGAIFCEVIGNITDNAELLQ